MSVLSIKCMVNEKFVVIFLQELYNINKTNKQTKDVYFGLFFFLYICLHGDKSEKKCGYILSTFIYFHFELLVEVGK